MNNKDHWLSQFSLRNAGVIYAFILVLAAFTLASAYLGKPFYLAERNVANILEQASLIGIMAVFMTVVLISGNFDLSVGSTAALSAAITLMMVDNSNIYFAIIAALSIGVVVGLINGILVEIVGVNAFIATLGTLTAIRGVVLLVTNARSVRPSNRDALNVIQSLTDQRWTTPNLLLIFGILVVLFCLWKLIVVHHWDIANLPPRLLWGVLVGILSFVGSFFLEVTIELAQSAYYFLVLTIIVWFVLTKTVVGRRLYAVGGNAEAARLSGIPVKQYRIIAFTLSGLAASFAGVLFASRIGAVNPNSLDGTALTVLAATILGGVSLFGGSGSVIKAAVGALILFTIDNGFNAVNLGSNYQQLIQGTIIISAAALYTVANRVPRKATEELSTQDDEVP